MYIQSRHYIVKHESRPRRGVAVEVIIYVYDSLKFRIFVFKTPRQSTIYKLFVVYILIIHYYVYYTILILLFQYHCGRLSTLTAPEIRQIRQKSSIFFFTFTTVCGLQVLSYTTRYKPGPYCIHVPQFYIVTARIKHLTWLDVRIVFKSLAISSTINVAV